MDARRTWWRFSLAWWMWHKFINSDRWRLNAVGAMPTLIFYGWGWIGKNLYERMVSKVCFIFCPHRYVLERKQTSFSDPYICRQASWKKTASDVKNLLDEQPPRRQDSVRVLYTPLVFHKQYSFLARVTAWSNPEAFFEPAFHSFSRGTTRKYLSRTNRELPKCCAARDSS